jgi:GNAT superfamily N-acetyltransferase
MPANGSEHEVVEILIRTARKRDFSDIAPLNAQLGYPESPGLIARRYRSILGDRQNHRLFVAVGIPVSSANAHPRGTVIGWIHVFIDKLLTVGPRAEIGGVVVDEKYRGRGVGSALLQRAEQWVRERGISPLVIRTNVVRTGAHTFYDKCGYQLLKQSKVFLKDIV